MSWVWVWSASLAVLAALALFDALVLQRGGGGGQRWRAAASGGVWLAVTAVTAWALHRVYSDQWPWLRSSVGDPGMGGDVAVRQFLAAIVIELTLSLDNVAVLALLVAYYKIPPARVGRVLLIGALASLVLRMLVILGVGRVLERVAWFETALGGVIVLAMLRTLVLPDEGTDFSRRRLARAVRRWVPIAPVGVENVPGARGEWFLVRHGGRLCLSTTGLVAVMAGLADTSLAVDSIPAVYAVTRDPFIAWTSNALSILALRSLYFGLGLGAARFRFLRLSVALVLLLLAMKTFRGEAWGLQPGIVARATLAIVALGVMGSVVHAWQVRATAGARAALEGVRPTPVEDLAEAAAGARRNLWRVGVLVVGVTIVLFGMLVVAPLPGPLGAVVVGAGLWVLGTEFVWARNLLNAMRTRLEQLNERTDRLVRRAPWWVFVMAAAGYAGFWAGAYWLAVVRLGLLGPSPVIGGALGGLFVPAWLTVQRVRRARAERAGARGVAPRATPSA
ncbi:MAG: hypothetical protein C0475_01875 [Planctomyces sp.]|nr:hypothetical protein [Planctomyces sp.]